MKNIFPKFGLKQLSAYVAIIVIFVYNNVLERDLECACTRTHQMFDCNFYMAAPFVVLLFLTLWIDGMFQSLWSYMCCRPRNFPCRLWYVFFFRLLKAAFIGLLWVISLFIDGDWYVCCLNDKREEYPRLACTDKNNTKPEEQEIIARLKNTSRRIGICILLGVVVLNTFILSRFKECFDTKLQYEKMAVKEKKKVLKEELKAVTKKQLTERLRPKIRDRQWDGCDTVVVDVIKERVPENQKTLVKVEYGGVQKYIIVPQKDEKFDFLQFLQAVRDKFSLQDQPQNEDVLNVTDSSGAEVDTDIFDELIKSESGTKDFKIRNGPSAPGPSAPGPSAPGPSSPGPSPPGPSAPGPSAPGPSAPGPSSPGPSPPGPSARETSSASSSKREVKPEELEMHDFSDSDVSTTGDCWSFNQGKLIRVC